MNILSQFRKIVLTKDGKRFVRGAQSRLAEALDCSRTTVKRYFIPDVHGDLWEPSEEKKLKLRTMLKNNWRPFTLKSGPVSQDDETGRLKKFLP